MSQGTYVNPLTDFGFKKLFGSEAHKNFLIDFLNQFLPHTIIDLKYAQNEHIGNTPLDRKAVFDLYCKSTTDDIFIVEVQKVRQEYFRDRSLYYTSFPIQEQAPKGAEWNFKLSPIYTVAILDFKLNVPQIPERVVHTVQLKDNDGCVFYDKLSFIYIELPNFTKSLEELGSQGDRWLYLLKHLAYLRDQPKELAQQIFEEVFRLAEISKFTPQERWEYEESLKTFRDIKNALDTAINDGIKIGEERGEKRGIELGKKRGEQEKAIAIANELKALGMSKEVIKQATGIDIDRIEHIFVHVIFDRMDVPSMIYYLNPIQ